MRPILLVLVPSVLAIHNKPNASVTQTLTRLQYHPPRAIIDTCISLNVALSTSDLGLVPSLLSALSDTCLCLKDLDLYLSSNNQIQSLVGDYGIEAVTAILQDLIKSPGSRQCSAPPPHARRHCTNDDPCHWSCEDNFIREGDVCVCSPPNKVCNGVCSETCAIGPSSIPLPKRKELVTTLAQAKATCGASETVCGIPGREDTLDFECINIDNSLDSCGGCMSAHLFTSQPQPLGKDCSQLFNALEVQCVNRSCVVHRCREGFEPSGNQDACIRSRMKKIRKRQESVTTNAVVDTNSKLFGQLAIILKFALKLKQDYSLLSSLDVGSFTRDNVYPLLQSLENVLTSPDTASLVTNTNSLLETTRASSERYTNCDCVDDLGLHDLAADTESILTAVIDLDQLLASYSLGTAVTSGAVNDQSSENATFNDTANMPIILGLSRLLDQLGLDMIKGDITVGGLDPSTNALVNSLLDGLGIGPSGVEKRSTVLYTNLDALLNLTLCLVHDTNDIITNSETYEVLRKSVRNVVQATVAFVEASRGGQSTGHELSYLGNSIETAIHSLEAGDQLAPIILDLNQIIGLLSTINASSASPSDALGLTSLINIVNKGLEIDAAASGLGLDTNLALSLYSTLHALGL